MAHIRFNRDSDEVACGKGIHMTFSKGERLVAGCMRTNKHPGKCIAMAYDAARADRVCAWCRAEVCKMHRKGCRAGKYMVECAFCLARFPSATRLVAYEYGIDCSARITSGLMAAIEYGDDGSILEGNYGSRYYCYGPYKFVGEPIGFENADPVCDGCILGFIEQGALKWLERT